MTENVINQKMAYTVEKVAVRRVVTTPAPSGEKMAHINASPNSEGYLFCYLGHVIPLNEFDKVFQSKMNGQRHS